MCSCKTGFTEIDSVCQGITYPQLMYCTFYCRSFCCQMLTNVKKKMATVIKIVPIQWAHTYAIAAMVSTSTLQIIKLAQVNKINIRYCLKLTPLICIQIWMSVKTNHLSAHHLIMKCAGTQ